MDPPSIPNSTEQPASSAPTPLSPRTERSIAENRLRAKALREQREAEQRRTGTVPYVPKTASGFVPTDTIHVVKPANKRRYDVALGGDAFNYNGNQPRDSSSNRNGARQSDDNGRPILPAAPKFAKFVDYNMSTMKDTKGGFLSAEDDPFRRHAKSGRPGEELRPTGMSEQQWDIIQAFRRRKNRAFEQGLTVLSDESQRKRCRECKSMEIDFTWEEVFHICVCRKCKEEMPEKYSLLTKTECKKDYLLTDSELRDAELLPHLSKPNPHMSSWHDMMLFLRFQVEEYATNTKWGSAEALDAEFVRRETQKKERNEAKFKSKLVELKRKTRTDAFRRQAGTLGKTGASRFGDAVGSTKHVHEWGRVVENEEGATVKTCVECGMEVEELEF